MEPTCGLRKLPSYKPENKSPVNSWIFEDEEEYYSFNRSRSCSADYEFESEKISGVGERSSSENTEPYSVTQDVKSDVSTWSYRVLSVVEDPRFYLSPEMEDETWGYPSNDELGLHAQRTLERLEPEISNPIEPIERFSIDSDSSFEFPSSLPSAKSPKGWPDTFQNATIAIKSIANQQSILEADSALQNYEENSLKSPVQLQADRHLKALEETNYPFEISPQHPSTQEGTKWLVLEPAASARGSQYQLVPNNPALQKLPTRSQASGSISRRRPGAYIPPSELVSYPPTPRNLREQTPSNLRLNLLSNNSRDITVSSLDQHNLACHSLSSTQSIFSFASSPSGQKCVGEDTMGAASLGLAGSSRTGAAISDFTHENIFHLSPEEKQRHRSEGITADAPFSYLGQSNSSRIQGFTDYQKRLPSMPSLKLPSLSTDQPVNRMISFNQTQSIAMKPIITPPKSRAHRPQPLILPQRSNSFVPHSGEWFHAPFPEYIMPQRSTIPNPTSIPTLVQSPAAQSYQSTSRSPVLTVSPQWHNLPLQSIIGPKHSSRSTTPNVMHSPLYPASGWRTPRRNAVAYQSKSSKPRQKESSNYIPTRIQLGKNIYYKLSNGKLVHFQSGEPSS